jgi:RNA polymerase sigma factor for flagellar operon FliA
MPPRAFRWPFQSAGRALPAEAVDEAWRRWHAERAPEARDVLVQRYIHLVRYMSNRLARALPPTVETEDLVSAGVMGFLAALEAFDPAHGVEFPTYALTRIRGAMVDFIREIDPVGRVTRRRLRALEQALAELEQELARSPSDAEAAARLGISLDEYHRLLAHATAASAVSLDRLEGDGTDDGAGPRRARLPDVSSPDPLARLLERDSADRVAELVGGLSAAQQLVLHLHYVEQLNFREIAMVMDISESRATQHHTAGVLALRKRLRRASEQTEALR